MTVAGKLDASIVDRAQGCLLGQLAGDALGSLVEFMRPEEIRTRYPSGVRDLADGGTWNTIAGQPTDDSEMALLLARMLAEKGTYDQDAARRQYEFWLDSKPFDVGQTTLRGIRHDPDHESEANGALMRVSPLGIFGAGRSDDELREWAWRDAVITHPNIVCQQVNQLFVLAIARAVGHGVEANSLYGDIVGWADMIDADMSVRDVVERARTQPPRDYVSQQGWVLKAFQNALWQLLHAPSLEQAVIDTVMRGGDTDTNAAIAGALLGAVHGRKAVPERWTTRILDCRPETGRPGVAQPRPKVFWPTDALELAVALVQGTASQY
ncbi:ADP-ribosylglycohydrolase family protein [Rhizobium sp.]